MPLTLPILDAFADPSDVPSVDGDPNAHVFDTEYGPHLFAVDGSMIFGLAADDAERARSDRGFLAGLLADAGLNHAPSAPDATAAMRSLSLSVAQACNLSCTYCYAREGGFGGDAKLMPVDTAVAAVDRLLGGARPGERVNVAFLGGEPLIGRDVIQAATRHATRRAKEAGVGVQFSVTTNGTLLTPDDATFFEEHGFAVTVSVDGVGDAHDRLRPFRNGRGSFDRVMERAALLLRLQRRMQVSARVTVTPANLGLRPTLDNLIGRGFHSVGFSPMLASPTGHGQMSRDDLTTMLGEMVACGREFERRVTRGERYPFSNAVTGLKELHRGAARPRPCGAGLSYFGVSADGELFACHRFVDDDAGRMGSVASGVDPARQAAWVAGRHVDRQSPCGGCWARYLCGGGCHHEVLHRGRHACDFIRGWLDYLLGAYVRLRERCPSYFAAAGPAA